MNVVRMDTAAISIGSSARNDAYTKIKHQQRAGRAEQRLDQNARPFRVAARRQQPVRRQAALEPLALGCLVEGRLERDLDVGAERDGDRGLDEGERRPAVVGDEALVARARERDDAQRMSWTAVSGSSVTAATAASKTSVMASWFSWTVSPSGTVTTAT